MDAGRAALETLKDSTEPYAMLSSIVGEVFGNYEEAIQLTEEGLRRHPENRMLLNNLAYYLLMKGDVRGARTILDGITERDDETHLRATRGLLLLKEGNIKEGSRLYNEAARRARGGELKSLVAQKKNLELARIAIADGRSLEAVGLLARAIAEKSGEETYRNQARSLLKALRGRPEA
jgi:thioredoxin-like negative regulator of GroEL